MIAKLIFGCGYLGSRVAARWRDAGERFAVVTRSPTRAAQFKAQGYEPIVADVTDPDSLHSLPAVQTVLFAVGRDRAADKSLEEVYVGGLAHVLAALPESVERFIYISSTGVYGPNAGDWVDEQSPCQPLREGGRACLAAEQILKTHPLGERSIILRLAGIYGPGRIPLAEKLKAGEPIPAPAEGFLNLIHVDDAAEVVLAAEARAPLPSCYCVADGHPAVRRDYYAELAEQLDAPPPTFVDPPASSPAAQRAASDKRVRNKRMLEELSVTLRYPSYRQGLAAIIAQE